MDNQTRPVSTGVDAPLWRELGGSAETGGGGGAEWRSVWQEGEKGWGLRWSRDEKELAFCQQIKVSGYKYLGLL